MNYYNENDPKAAAWLQALIDAGEIPYGIVDQRSIVDVKPEDLRGFIQHHFFAGIGGWSLALRIARWPDKKPICTCSCPCQPFSPAGLGLGIADPRHLWPVFFRLVQVFRFPIITGEQVSGKDGLLWLSGVRTDLANEGYTVGACDLCSAGVGSPHLRQRLHWMAYAKRDARKPGRTANEWVKGIRTEIGGSHAEFGRRGMSGSGVEYSQSFGRLERRSESDRRSVASGCALGGVADSDGRISSDGNIQRSGEHGQQSEDSSVGGLAHINGGKCDGLSKSEGCESDGTTPRRFKSDCELKCDSSTRPPGFVGNANIPRPQRRRIDPCECGDQWTPWSASELIDCTDGKSRRVEPSSFPLAHGFPSRVGLLRGFGNAINPFLAAQFIQACEEAKADEERYADIE